MSGGKAVLLGDDTWSRLMPKRWLRSHALYSFHTWDLDTVDNGKYFTVLIYQCVIKCIILRFHFTLAVDRNFTYKTVKKQKKTYTMLLTDNIAF